MTPPEARPQSWRDGIRIFTKPCFLRPYYVPGIPLHHLILSSRQSQVVSTMTYPCSLTGKMDPKKVP